MSASRTFLLTQLKGLIQCKNKLLRSIAKWAPLYAITAGLEIFIGVTDRCIA